MQCRGLNLGLPHTKYMLSCLRPLPFRFPHFGHSASFLYLKAPAQASPASLSGRWIQSFPSFCYCAEKKGKNRESGLRAHCRKGSGLSFPPTVGKEMDGAGVEACGSGVRCRGVVNKAFCRRGQH